MSTPLYALGIGIGTRNVRDKWLEVWYPRPLFRPKQDLDAVLVAAGYNRDDDGSPDASHKESRKESRKEPRKKSGKKSGNTSSNTSPNKSIELEKAHITPLANALTEAGETELAEHVRTMTGSHRPLVATVLVEDSPPECVPSAYLKLHLLSHRLVQPNETNLEGIFAVLPNVAWTSEGAIDVAELEKRQMQARMEGRELEVSSVDKFPKMTNYVVPPGVRVAHTARVRLGAYLGEGATVMHEGFINFNAGALGPGMIEGRVSAGVVVGEGSDVGGGASIMGTLSGGGDVLVSMGRDCLLGANAGLGIPLGDRCTVEAGLYLTAGARVSLLDDKGAVTGEVKARELAGRSDLLFRRNSVTGAVECLPNRSRTDLNPDLHDHN